MSVFIAPIEVIVKSAVRRVVKGFKKEEDSDGGSSGGSTFTSPAGLISTTGGMYVEVPTLSEQEASPTLFTDSAGTIACTAYGDPVGCWKDSSNNAYDVIQGTTARRPTWRQTAGGHAYLEFDGADDFIGKDDFPAIGTGALSMIVAFSTTEPGVTDYLANVGTLSGCWAITPEYAVRTEVGSQTYDATPVSGTKSVVSSVFPGNVDVSNGRLYHNSVAAANVTTKAGIPNIVAGVHFSQLPGVGSKYLQMHLYGALIVDSVLSDADRTSTEQHFADRMGITL